ncbi:MAG: GNAT family N-acetyltransferase [Clostridia bacterium]|nr:GNAT family N-acetyltransferase [Clostridia bacterium]
MTSEEIDFLSVDRVLRRGTGEILEEQGRTLLAYDRVSGAHFLRCGGVEEGLSLLARHRERNIRLLMTFGEALGRAACERFGFADMFECYQVAWLSPPPIFRQTLVLREAEEADLPLLTRVYDLISPEELAQVVKRRSLLLGYRGGALVGFIGEHLEGSMGLLYVFPAFRRQGAALELERHFIARTLEKGFIPFGQVEKNNRASLALQEKVGMARSENLNCWMWK